MFARQLDGLDEAVGLNPERMMRIWREGDRSEAICPACERRMATRFEVRVVRLEERGIDVPDVLVAVCAGCGGTVSIPAQSAPKLRQARERAG